MEKISRLQQELNAIWETNGVYLPPEKFERLQNLPRHQREEINFVETPSERKREEGQFHEKGVS